MIYGISWMSYINFCKSTKIICLEHDDIHCNINVENWNLQIYMRIYIWLARLNNKQWNIQIISIVDPGHRDYVENEEMRAELYSIIRGLYDKQAQSITAIIQIHICLTLKIYNVVSQNLHLLDFQDFIILFVFFL